MALGTDCNGPRAFRTPGKPPSEPQEMTRAGSLSPSMRAKEHRWQDRDLLSIYHSAARAIRKNGKGAEPPCPAQPRHGAQPLWCLPGSGRQAALSHRWHTRAQPPHTHPGLCSSCCQPGARLFPLWERSQSSATIAGPWCAGSPAARTQQGSGTVYSLHTFPLAKRDFLGIFGLRCF